MLPEKAPSNQHTIQYFFNFPSVLVYKVDGTGLEPWASRVKAGLDPVPVLTGQFRDQTGFWPPLRTCSEASLPSYVAPLAS